MAKQKDGCVKPARGVLAPKPQSDAPAGGTAAVQEEQKMQARVGREAIDFEANGYIEGVGFDQIKLSDHKGKWIVLCFYPGDFTFV